jgi:alpha-1,6-mannosyltransferase
VIVVRCATTLHLTNAYHPTSGGIRTFYRALLDGADERGRAMHLVVPAEHTGTEPVGQASVIHHLAAARAPGFDRRYRLLTPRHYARSGSPVQQLLATLRPDVVEVCDKYTLAPVAWLMRRAADRPTLVGFSCERMDDNVAAYVADRGVARTIARAYVRRIYVPPFDAHLANSSYTAAELVENGAAAEAVHLCGMGVDEATFGAACRDETLRRRLLRLAGGGEHGALVLYAGRLSPEKHLDLLIDAVATLHRAHGAGGPDVRLVMVGEGPAEPRLQRLAARAGGGRIAFLHHLADRQALAAHLAAADVFVHPNPREPFGIGPLEAMAAGVPVVVPDAGGVRAYASEQNAWLARPGAAGLAAAIAAALKAGPADSRVARARDTASAHAWSSAVDRYFAVIDLVHSIRASAAARASQVGTPRPWPTPGH